MNKADPKLSEKRWSREIEKSLLEEWKEEYDFSFKPDSEKKVYTVDVPPPYPSGDPHPGQAAHYAWIDMIIRSRRMMGYNVVAPACLDKNGINIERTVEKKTGKSLHEFDREEFIRLCREEIAKYGDKIFDIFESLGASFDRSIMYETDSPEYRAFSQALFIELWKRGLVIEDMRPNIYCPHCKTSLSEADVFFKEIPGVLNYVRWKVEETGEEIEIATTRPELLCACQAILVNPGDERYKHLHGKHATLPLYNRSIPIYPHSYAKPEFGSGIVMVCSFGDTSDIMIFRELQLEQIKAIDEEGKMTESSGKYAGMSIKEARERIIEDLNAERLITKQEKIMHRSPVCERCETPVEFILLKEWYIKQLEFLDDVRKVADEINFYPKKNKRILLDWIDAITIDWPISRRRYYHTEIPLWYCKKCGEPLAPEPGKYYQPWKDPAPFDKCPKCGGTEFRGEEKVFDTWVDSSVSNLYVSGYLKNEELFEKGYPTSLRPQGREIVRTWLYYALLRNKQLLNQPAFKDVIIDGLGMADDGTKMSKSKGNYIEPLPLIEKHGADAFRLWKASESNVGDDFRISEERIEGSAKFLTKLWNVARFVSMFPEAEKPKDLNPTDRWILTEANRMIAECWKGYEVYNMFPVAWAVRNFVWNIFAPHYLEMVKQRAYEGDESARYAMHEVLKIVLKLLAPITPFMSDKVYRSIYGGRIHYEQFPEKPSKAEGDPDTEKLIEFNSMIWKKKKQEGVSLKAEAKGITLPAELEKYKPDLVKMHNIVE